MRSRSPVFEEAATEALTDPPRTSQELEPSAQVAYVSARRWGYTTLFAANIF
jgi:hypothetical protein